VPSVGKESRHAIIISCLDNLIKGASGAAVQNFNLMNGFDERTALL
jgi:N-acetyl-gamma-glutamyl-phosphate reductase